MIIAFKPWHLGVMRLPGNVRGLVDAPAARRLEALANAQLAGTIVSAGEAPVILGVVGALPLSAEEAEVFVLSTEDRDDHRVEFAKSVRRVLDDIRRVYAKIVALGEPTPDLRRWFRWLGFTCEGFSDRAGCEGLLKWSMGE